MDIWSWTVNHPIVIKRTYLIPHPTNHLIRDPKDLTSKHTSPSVVPTLSHDTLRHKPQETTHRIIYLKTSKFIKIVPSTLDQIPLCSVLKTSPNTSQENFIHIHNFIYVHICGDN